MAEIPMGENRQLLLDPDRFQIQRRSPPRLPSIAPESMAAFRESHRQFLREILRMDSEYRLRMAKIESRMADLENRVANQIADQEKQIANLERTMADVENRIADVENGIAVLRCVVPHVDRSVTHIESRAANLLLVAALNRTRKTRSTKFAVQPIPPWKPPKAMLPKTAPVCEEEVEVTGGPETVDV
ncbi:hypothetical protein HK104_006240 [Borealophlyctis nickersoniae]|nr:hypothetical protein HK104_006240 [Borealophlyctis nickersoniae]